MTFDRKKANITGPVVRRLYCQQPTEKLITRPCKHFKSRAGHFLTQFATPYLANHLRIQDVF